MLVAFFRTVFRPVVRDRAGVRTYVASVTLFAWVIAAAADVVQKWLDGGFIGLLSQELGTLIVVIVVAVPIARTMGFAHLKLYHAQREAERLSRSDPLTGLANRRAFHEAAAGFKGGAIALAIADIDRFKRINDTHGHAAGDVALTAVAHIMRDELSDLGLVARLGGEEFGLLTCESDAQKVRERLQRFRQRVADSQVTVEGHSIAVTVSAGFAVRAAAEMDALYSDADRALYVAKAAGRDRVVAFDEIGTERGEASLRYAS